MGYFLRCYGNQNRALRVRQYYAKPPSRTKLYNLYKSNFKNIIDGIEYQNSKGWFVRSRHLGLKARLDGIFFFFKKVNFWTFFKMAVKQNTQKALGTTGTDRDRGAGTKNTFFSVTLYNFQISGRAVAPLSPQSLDKVEQDCEKKIQIFGSDFSAMRPQSLLVLHPSSLDL